MRVLITGGAGLIGRECAAQFLAGGHQVRVLDLRADEMAAAPALERVKGDFLDAGVRRACLKKAEGLVHLAAVSRVQEAEEDKPRARATNAAGTSELLESAARQGRRAPWLVHASSREVYGEPEEVPVREDAPVQPINEYGLTKAVAEHAANAYAAGAGRAAAILRFSNVYGSIHDNPRRVIPIFTRRALSGETIEVHGATKTFDFVHVSDAARAVLAAATWAAAEEGPRGATVNIATGRGTTLGELASKIIASCDSKSKVVETSKRDFDVLRFVGDGARAKALWGFECRVGLDEGLRRTITITRDALRAKTA